MYGTTKILPLAAIYGPNASGKGNLIDALDFLAYLVVDGVQLGRPIPVEPYRLSSATLISPTKFDIRILVNDRIYRYAISINRKGILEESLWLQRSRREEPLFVRVGSTYDFPNTLGTEPDRLRFIAEGTRQNQLFLNSAVSQNVIDLQPILRLACKEAERSGHRCHVQRLHRGAAARRLCGLRQSHSRAL